jgi:DNA-binding response OmpR family regulator
MIDGLVERKVMFLKTDILNKKILIVDDEIELIVLMEAVLRKEGFSNIYKAKTGDEAIQMCKRISPDIILLDIMLPDVDGFEVCKEIRRETYVPVIFLSAKSDDFDKFLAFKLGADDYVTKPFSPQEVVLRIIANLKRNTYVKEKKEEIIQCNHIKMDLKKRKVMKWENEVYVTAKEYKLLLYMIQNVNCILRKNIICLNVWGIDFEGYDNTVMVHIRKLREKLEDDPSNPKLIKTIKSMGYKLCTQDE